MRHNSLYSINISLLWYIDSLTCVSGNYVGCIFSIYDNLCSKSDVAPKLFTPFFYFFCIYLLMAAVWYNFPSTHFPLLLMLQDFMATMWQVVINWCDRLLSINQWDIISLISWDIISLTCVSVNCFGSIFSNLSNKSDVVPKCLPFFILLNVSS